MTNLEEYLKDVVKCDWCNKDVERKIAKFWHTGARICPSCHDEGVDKDRKFQEEFRQEMSKGSFLDNRMVDVLG